MFIWLCEKNELGNLEESNLICDLAIADLKDSKTPKYPQKKSVLAHINYHLGKKLKKFLDK